MTQLYHSEYPKQYIIETCAPMLITTLFTLVKMYNQTKGPTAAERIKKMWCGCTMEFYSDIQKNEITVFAEYGDATEDHHLI